MALPICAQMHQSPASPPDTWKLAARRAMTFRPRETGVLRVAHGRLWATCDGPHAGALNESGDHIVDAGGELRLRAGQHWVIEAWHGDSPACFSWEPAPGR
jgi:hypothetical protein